MKWVVKKDEYLCEIPDRFGILFCHVILAELFSFKRPTGGYTENFNQNQLMKVAFLNASISRMAGGVFEVQRRLAQNLNDIKGVSIEVFGIEDQHTQNDIELWRPFNPIVHKPKGPAGFAFSPTLASSLKLSDAELIHLHVLWLYPSIAALNSNKPYITTIHGMLDSWALQNSRLKKRVVASLYENKALRRASCLQAITSQEYSDIRNYGLKNPVCMIPNGVDIPANIEEVKREPAIWKDKISSDKKILLYLGRIHPKKGLTNLIKAWKELGVKLNKNSDWVLAIAGWDQAGYENELKQLTKDLHLEDDIFFLGPQFNKNKDLCFAHADAFILPSFSEGLPMAVLEAWAYNLPVLKTRQCNLPEGFDKGAALKIEASVEGISDGLGNLMSSSQSELEAMGSKGRRLVIERFNWKNVAGEMNAVYNWILKRGPEPETLILT